MATEEGNIRIPPEIITEILRRLPSKSLGRFKCVSKDWLSLISQPQFIKTHQNTLNRNHLIFLNTDFSIYSLPFNHHESPVSSRPTKLRLESPRLSMFTFEGSCNGLVLVSAHHFDGGDTLVILNPTTREFIELRDSIHDLYGFGYDSLTDDYKVFAISYTHVMSVHVYSLRTKTWKRLIDSPHYLPYGRCLRGVFVNGFLHWIAKKKVESHENSPVILAFSLADEELGEVPSPNWSNGVNIMSKNDCKLAVVGEKLAIFLEVEGEVWLMNDYGVRESWTKILSHKLDDRPIVEPMILYDNGKILLASNGRMLIHDVEKSSFCGSIDFAVNLVHLNVKCICTESLVSPNFN